MRVSSGKPQGDDEALGAWFAGDLPNGDTLIQHEKCTPQVSASDATAKQVPEFCNDCGKELLYFHWMEW